MKPKSWFFDQISNSLLHKHCRSRNSYCLFFCQGQKLANQFVLNYKNEILNQCNKYLFHAIGYEKTINYMGVLYIFFITTIMC